MTNDCNICGKECSSVPWVHPECLDAIVAERDALVAVEQAESLRLFEENVTLRKELTLSQQSQIRCYISLQEANEQIYVLRAALKEALDALEAVEWVPVFNTQLGYYVGFYCDWCKAHDSNGHAPDCQRQAALGLAEGE